jgi:prevent-host-death family protein
MVTISATEAKNRLGEYIEQAHRAPVMVQKAGRNSVVIVDSAEYERLVAMEDAYWGERAMAAKEAGYLSPEESMAFIQQRLAEE